MTYNQYQGLVANKTLRGSRNSFTVTKVNKDTSGNVTEIEATGITNAGELLSLHQGNCHQYEAL